MQDGYLKVAQEMNKELLEKLGPPISIEESYEKRMERVRAEHAGKLTDELEAIRGRSTVRATG